MQQLVYARFCEHLVPAGLTRRLMPLLFPGKNPFTEANDRTRSIFVHIPKTAGTSIADVLYGGPSRHIAIGRFMAYDPERAARYFRFCFVRNPWDRLASAYHYLRGSLGINRSFDVRWAEANLAQFGTFEEFVLALDRPAMRRRILSYIHFMPQYRWITLPYCDRVEMDFVGRFEDLEAGFVLIRERFGIVADLPVRRAGGHPDYRSCYSARTRAIAAQLYARDIALLGYRFDNREAA